MKTKMVYYVFVYLFLFINGEFDPSSLLSLEGLF